MWVKSAPKFNRKLDRIQVVVVVRIRRCYITKAEGTRLVNEFEEPTASKRMPLYNHIIAHTHTLESHTLTYLSLVSYCNVLEF